MFDKYILQGMINGAAVVGMTIFWWGLTKISFKTAWQISNYRPEEYKLKAVSTVVCEECQEHFFHDGNELKHGRFLCETCSDHELEKRFSEI